MRKSVARWDPFREFERGFGFPFKRMFAPSPFSWRPVIDSFETEKEVVVTAELPGVEKDEVKLKVSERGLSLRVESKKKHEEEKKGEGYYRYEYSSRFEGLSEFVPFESEVKPSEAKASFKNGVLEVRVPKKELAKGRNLRVE